MTNSKLYTIGYGNKTITEIFSTLRKYGIEKLIDVRSVPYSRYRRMFNKNSLLSLSKSEGMEYIFKGEELGARLNGTYPSYEVLRERVKYMEGLQYLIQQLQEGQNIAIMCCESDCQNCHRYSLIGEDMFQLGYDVVHIDKRGDPVSHQGLIL